jgi:hypothetical protein
LEGTTLFAAISNNSNQVNDEDMGNEYEIKKTNKPLNSNDASPSELNNKAS